MKKRMRLWALLLCLALTISCFAACGNDASSDGDKTNTPTPTQGGASSPEATPTIPADPTEPPLFTDLGNMEIIIGDWWSTEEVTPPQTAQEEATQEYRRSIQEDYNFTMKQISLGGWGDHQEGYVLSVMANKPKASVYIMDQSFVAQPLANNMMYDLATLKSFDFTESKWNQTVLQLMSYEDSIYGMATGKPEPRLGVFWNKRMFEDAGLDPDLPYDLQASGEWTWDKFYEICSQLTIDRDNDGITDTYALASFSVEFLRGAAASNGAKFIDMQDNKYVETISDPKFLEALQWGVSIIDAGFVMPKAEDAEWDWFIPAFHDCNVAMTVAEQYKTGTWSDMEDDFGFVMFPKGPNKDHYMTYFADNIVVIPGCFDADTAEKIAFAYDLWTDPTPGYEAEDDWKTTYYTVFRDERAVDETLTMMFQDGYSILDYLPSVYGVSYGDIAYGVYARSATPQEQIETVLGNWTALLAEANDK